MEKGDRDRTKIPYIHPVSSGILFPPAAVKCKALARGERLDDGTRKSTDYAIARISPMIN